MPEPPDPDAFIITVGGTSFNVQGGQVKTGINKPDTAGGTVPADQIARSPADWAAPARLAVGNHVLASGQIVEALPRHGGSVALSLNRRSR